MDVPRLPRYARDELERLREELRDVEARIEKVEQGSSLQRRLALLGKGTYKRDVELRSGLRRARFNLMSSHGLYPGHPDYPTS